MTLTQLQQIIPSNKYYTYWHSALTELLPEYSIDTPQRCAAFLSQCAHESMEFNAIIENLNYRWQTLLRVFPKYFVDEKIAKEYAGNQTMIANRVYSNRMGNGGESSGDGYSYCGRGLIQITGKNNYQAFADSIETPLESIPEYLQTFEGAAQSACWFWETNNLNQYADSSDIVTLTKRINGGTHGLEDRIARYNNALVVLNT